MTDLDINQINPMAAIVAVGTDMKNPRKLVISSDYEFQTRKPNGSESEVIVTIPDDISGVSDPKRIIMINAPAGSGQVDFKTHMIDERNLRILIIK